jgi:hypothetical protein
MIGYRAFNADCTNDLGEKFEVNETHHVDGVISAKFGQKGNGYYFYTDLADVFRFEDPDKEIKVAVVEASGSIDRVKDEYNNYLRHACSDLKVIKYLSREEILNIVISEGVHSIDKFIRTYNLTNDETDVLLDNIRGENWLIERVLWYQGGMKDIHDLKFYDRQDRINNYYQQLDNRLKENKVKKMI